MLPSFLRFFLSFERLFGHASVTMGVRNGHNCITNLFLYVLDFYIVIYKFMITTLIQKGLLARVCFELLPSATKDLCLYKWANVRFRPRHKIAKARTMQPIVNITR